MTNGSFHSLNGTPELDGRQTIATRKTATSFAMFMILRPFVSNGFTSIR